MRAPTRFLSLLVLLAALVSSRSIAAPAENPSRPFSVIFDTDMSGDCDDVGALAILNKFADDGEVNLIACVGSGHDQDKAIAASIDAVNTYYGRPDVPIGTYQGRGFPPSKSRYTAHLRNEFPHTALPDDQEPAALTVYRTALASAQDGSVTIVSTGFLINLAELLQSSPDAASPLPGAELVREKVRQLVVMGGQFPKSDPNRGEYNFSYGGGGPATKAVAEQWPTPVLFSGYEIGAAISTGTRLASAPGSNPVRRAYELYTSFKGRPSWDLTAALAAVRDPTLYWTVASTGSCRVNANGTDEWIPGPACGRSYLVAKVPPAEVAHALDDLLALPPKLP